MAEPEAMEVSGGEEPQQEQAKGSSDASAAEEAAPDPAKETAGKPELADGEEGEDDEVCKRITRPINRHALLLARRP